MMKKFVPLMAAAALFLATEAADAQVCPMSKKEAAGECHKKCDGDKQKETKTEEQPTFNFSVITLDQLNSFLATPGSVTLFDARDQESYENGHINGAIHFASTTLPADKNATLVFYCGGPKCGAAPKAARGAMEQGYSNVMVFTGGWLEWSEAQSSQASL